MINPELHKEPAVLDRILHRQLRLLESASPLKVASTMNSAFVTAAEFGDACKDHPLLFLRAGTRDDKPQAVPVAVMGLEKNENLFVETDAQGQLRWSGRYMPAYLRAYPFTMAQVAEGQWAVCVDRSFDGFSETEGRPLFDDKGEPTPLMRDMQAFVEQLEAEIERTRQACERLLELNLLQDKRFDATLPDGSPLVLEGFLAVNEERLAALSDAEVAELHRNGLLGVLMAHQISMGNMRSLIERRLARLAAQKH